MTETTSEKSEQMRVLEENEDGHTRADIEITKRVLSTLIDKHSKSGKDPEEEFELALKHAHTLVTIYENDSVFKAVLPSERIDTDNQSTLDDIGVVDAADEPEE